MKLLAAGYQVFTATDGSEAIAAVGEHQPDFILLDFNFPPDVSHGGLPGWDGLRLLNWLRSLKGAERARFIMITSEDPAGLEHHPLAAPVAAFFQKPINHQQLLATIAAELGASPVRRSRQKLKDEVDEGH